MKEKEKIKEIADGFPKGPFTQVIFMQLLLHFYMAQFASSNCVCRLEAISVRLGRDLQCV